jgi:hypothetical protein
MRRIQMKIQILIAMHNIHHHLPDFLEEGDITHHHIIVILGCAIIIAVGNVGMAGVEVETVVHGEKDVKADDGLVNSNKTTTTTTTIMQQTCRSQIMLMNPLLLLLEK